MSILTSLLARDAVVSVDAIEEALQRQVLEGGEIDSALLEIDALPENLLCAYRAAAYDLPPVTREQLTDVPAGVLQRLPAEQARALWVVPIASDGERLTVAAPEPPGEARLQRLREAAGMDVEVRIGLEARIAAALAAHYGMELPSRLRRLVDALQQREAGETREVQPPSSPAPAPARNSPPSGETALRSAPPPPDRAPSARQPAPPADLSDPKTPAAGAAAPAVRVMKVVSLGPAPPTATPAPRPASGGARADVPKDDDTSPQRPSKLPPPIRGGASRVPRQRMSHVPKGPMTPELAERLLEEATDRDEVLDVVFAFARQYFDCTVLFAVREGHLLGLEASGARTVDDPRVLDISFGGEGSIHDAVFAKRHLVRDLWKAPLDRPLPTALGRRQAQPGALLAIAVRRRVVALLYGDREGERFEIEELAELVEMLPRVTRAFERIIQERKVFAMQAQRGGSPPPPAVDDSGESAGARAAAEPAGPGPGAALGEHGRRREVSLSRVDHPFRRSQVGARLAQAARSSLGLRDGGLGAQPPTHMGIGGPPQQPGDDLVSQPTVQLDAVRVGDAESGAADSRPRRADGSYSYRPGVPRGDRETTRPARRSSRSPPPAAAAEPEPEHDPSGAPGPGTQSASADGPVVEPPADTRPPPRTLSQPPPGAGSYSVRTAGAEVVGSPAARPSQPPASVPPAPAVPSASPGRPTPRSRDDDDPGKTARGRRRPARPDPRRETGDEAVRSERVSIPPSVRESLHSPPPAEPEPPEPEGLSIDLGSEAQRVVTELARCAPDDEGPFVAALLRLGDPALEALTRRFPGALWFDRHAPHHRLPAGRDVSACARALYAFEERAAPHLERLLRSSRADVRLYALLLAGDRVLPELASAIGERVFDDDGQVRLAAFEILPLYRNVDGFGEVLERLRRRAGAATEPLQHRLSAVEALSALRDPGSVELMLELSGHDSRQLSLPAHRALVAITGQDFGDSGRRWRSWLRKHGGRHRAEWLIDGLMHSEESVREVAGHELQKLSQVYYGYSASAPKRDRERAQARYRSWWETTGRSQFVG
ncbi:MAG: hypothetical protein PVI30_01540 [Myxococcales bacterium]|jgi:hypothetical protein